MFVFKAAVVGAGTMARKQARVRLSGVSPQWSELAGAAATCVRWIRAASGVSSGLTRVVVRDRSPAIPRQERETVFDPFSRGRSNGCALGAGLARFVARRVLDAQGGWISLRPSRSGARFVLALPAERWQLSAS